MLVIGCIEAKFASIFALKSSRRDLHNAVLCTALNHMFSKICENKPLPEPRRYRSAARAEGLVGRGAVASDSCKPVLLNGVVFRNVKKKEFDGEREMEK